MHTVKLPETGFLRLPQVLSFVPVGRTTWWEGVRRGIYPSPVRIGARAVRWRAEDIRVLIRRLGAEA